MAYIGLSIVYDFALDDEGKKGFEDISAYCSKYTSSLPIILLLGFFTSTSMQGYQIVEQYSRWIVLGWALTFRLICKPLKRVFPTLVSLENAGLLLPHERLQLESELAYNHPIVVVQWNLALLKRCNRQGLFMDFSDYQRNQDNLMTFKKSCGDTIKFAAKNIPFALIQAVTITVYSYGLASLMARQLTDEHTPTSFTIRYFPVLNAFQYFLYYLWLQFGRLAAYPFSDEENDIDIKRLLQAHVDDAVRWQSLYSSPRLTEQIVSHSLNNSSHEWMENDKSLFYVPSGKLEEWQKIVTKPGLKKTSKLCEEHFEKCEIFKGVQVGNDFVPTTRNRLLTKSVVPTKNLGGTATYKHTRKVLKPCILNIGSTAGGPRLRTKPCTKIQKPQPWPPELVAAITSLVHQNATETVGRKIHCVSANVYQNEIGAPRPTVKLRQKPLGALLSTRIVGLKALPDEEIQINEDDSGLAASLEASPIQNSKEVINEAADDNLSPPKEIAPSADDPDTSKLSKDTGNSIPSLSMFQKAKIERNRQKALLLRQARLQAHPYNNGSTEEHSVIRIKNSRLIDSGGGFLINEKELEEEQQREIVITQDPAPIILPDRPHCDECEQPLHDSLLYRSFSYPVCDPCKDTHDEKYGLITRTDARQEYLLKDCDLDLREPILRYILRKNPLNPNWGDMKLYLRLQASLCHPTLELWETLEKIEEEKELREAKREKTKIKKFNQQIKNLRMAVRSSVYKKQTAGHQHVFGEEKFNAERDLYYRKCSTCSFQQEYEKM
uniref:EOG090X0KP6 n=1 Tax=Daphnia lumholtzi TaxID=42856 RepID=A0A4Y7MHK4_9CRUS|nr:EOG090X0KP6 [Daphnia lumholtzi]